MSATQPMAQAPHSALALAAYGALGLPLAMSALPVYVQIPAYYSTHLGLALAGTGWVLFLARLIDTLQDPWLGRCIDRLHGRALNGWLITGALLLVLAFGGLWLPQVSGGYLTLWLAVMLVVAYTAHSMLNIAYLAWGARLGQEQQLLGAAGWREGAGLVGVILASVIPSWLMTMPTESLTGGLVVYSGAFAVIVLLSLTALLRWAPQWHKAPSSALSWSQALRLMRQNTEFTRLLWPYVVNAISVSIPATLALFFINDRIGAPQLAGVFLAAYFIAAALGLPVWVRFAQRFGVLCSWRLGMLLAILSFCGASWLGQGDSTAYLLVCIAAGLALGADLALPPVLLARLIPSDEAAATYYGVWTLLGKLALALSGLALPLLAVLGYTPGIPAGAELAWVYAGVPCLFKLLALVLLRNMGNVTIHLKEQTP
ncbi:MFS transporter [Chitinibacter fontanus]|uniref:MFS transporter n=1 Tax=Chitinibacter fontanus TaxID=1737446 RepID=A0A7D5VB94_9NEIS|nr:MFS transporter [Chitinibacter fontanus]QLI82857.1 MFS transporter [Chitinibacter fontanus]